MKRSRSATGGSGFCLASATMVGVVEAANFASSPPAHIDDASTVANSYRRVPSRIYGGPKSS